MKVLYFFLIGALGWNFHLGAATFEITQLCQNRPAEKIEFTALFPENVGKISVDLMQTYAIAFNASSSTIASIFNTPTGEEAIEVLGKRHIRAYGWCFEVDGKGSGLRMDQFIFDPGAHSHIKWLFGYAEYYQGKWIKFCEPLYNHSEDFICAN